MCFDIPTIPGSNIEVHDAKVTIGSFMFYVENLVLDPRFMVLKQYQTRYKLPATMSMFKQSATAGGQVVNVKSKPFGGSKDVEKLCKLSELPSGFMGKMLVYKSGAVRLKLGNTLYDVSTAFTR
ncbi:hypothetical protein Fmac_013222 [Flemingia macrophylla]|uniref:Uncharacterized protein n=1 Tax=Flemingia macrophylla TaxID=520843 RepID=A0ABD1MT01_9FABA